MDTIDLDILKCLRENSRSNASMIGAKIKMSVSAVIERIKKMERSGVIKQYTVILDAKKIHRDVSAYILIGLEHPKFNDHFISAVQKDDHITENYYIAGNFDFMVKVVTDTTEAMTQTLNDIKSIEGVSHTVTLVVLSSVKELLPSLPCGAAIQVGRGEEACQKPIS